MSETLQEVLALGMVLAVAGFALYRRYRGRRAGGCGACSGCASTPTERAEVRLDRSP